MANYYTDEHESDVLSGDFEHLSDYRQQCEDIAKGQLLENPGKPVKVIVFDFTRNKSVIFVFTAELKISCTEY